MVVTSAERESLYGTSRLVRWGFLAVTGRQPSRWASQGTSSDSTRFGLETAPSPDAGDGTGDLGVDISTARQDEVGRLYDAFENAGHAPETDTAGAGSPEGS